MSSILPEYANFFESVPKNNIVEDGFVSKILPLTAISTDNSVIEFVIPPLNQNLISPSNIRYVVKFKIIGSDGKPAPEAAVENEAFYTILNSAASSIFADLHVLVNGQHVSSANNLYPLVGHLQNLISDLNRKRVDLLTCGFVPEAEDEASVINSTPALIRSKFVAAGKEATFIGSIINGIFQENKLLPPQTTLGIRFFPAKSSFFIFSKTKTYSLKITSLHLEVKYLKIDSNFIIKTIETMKHKPYTLKHLCIKPKTIVLSAGINNITLANVLNGKMPVKLFFTFIANKNMLGSFDTNCLDFKPFNLSSYLIRINEKCYPNSKLNFSFESGKNYMELYNHFLQNMTLTGNACAGITMNHFASGAFLMMENLLYDGGLPFYTEAQTGTMSIELEFSSVLSEAVSLLLMPVYASTLEIDLQGSASVTQ